MPPDYDKNHRHIILTSHQSCNTSEITPAPWNMHKHVRIVRIYMYIHVALMDTR